MVIEPTQAEDKILRAGICKTKGINMRINLISVIKEQKRKEKNEKERGWQLQINWEKQWRRVTGDLLRIGKSNIGFQVWVTAFVYGGQLEKNVFCSWSVLHKCKLVV